MSPRSYQSLLAQLSVNKNLPLDLVTLIVEDYYHQVGQLASGFVSNRITCPGLGSFEIRPKRLQKRIDWLISYVSTLEKSLLDKPDFSLSRQQTLKNRRAELAQLQDVNRQYQAEQSARQEHRHQKTISSSAVAGSFTAQNALA